MAKQKFLDTKHLAREFVKALPRKPKVASMREIACKLGFIKSVDDVPDKKDAIKLRAAALLAWEDGKITITGKTRATRYARA